MDGLTLEEVTKARNGLTPSARTIRRCEGCGAKMPGATERKCFCSSACRQREARCKRAGRPVGSWSGGGEPEPRARRARKPRTPRRRAPIAVEASSPTSLTPAPPPPAPSADPLSELLGVLSPAVVAVELAGGWTLTRSTVTPAR
jgi:hypothetical protein